MHMFTTPPTSRLFIALICYFRVYYQQNIIAIEEKTSAQVIRRSLLIMMITLGMLIEYKHTDVYRSCRIVWWERDELVYEEYSQYSKHVHARWIMTMMSNIISRFIYLPFYKLVVLFMPLVFLFFILLFWPILLCQSVVHIYRWHRRGNLDFMLFILKKKDEKEEENVCARSLSSNDGFNNSALSSSLSFRYKDIFVKKKP